MASSSSSASQANAPRPTTAGKPDRLYVGNLSQTVDEYTLLQVFGKYGKITRLDVMYHKTGPQKGKPRGYAFVEFSNKDDALNALVKLHDRLLRGKKLIVTYASAAPAEDFLGPKVRRIDAPKPTALSLLKTAKKPQSAAQQIAAMEAKLAQLQKRPGRSPSPPRQVTASEAADAANALEAEIERELLAGDAAASGPSGASTPANEGRRSRSTSPRKPSDTSSSSRRESERASERARGLASLPPKPV